MQATNIALILQQESYNQLHNFHLTMQMWKVCSAHDPITENLRICKGYLNFKCYSSRM